MILLLAVFSVNAFRAPSLIQQTENPRYGLDFWREAEGLPQSRIRAITQTSDGYLWLGTDNGAVRFNGASFTAFTVETGSLRDNEVWALLEDNDDGLWMGTYGGGLTLFRDGNFTTFTSADGLPDDVILQLDKDAEGNIWMATPSGVTRYAKGVFTHFTTKDGLAGNYINALCAHSPKGVLVATGNDLYQFQDGKFTRVTGVVGPGEKVIEHIVAGRDGSIWLSFSAAMVKRWKDDDVTTYTDQDNLTTGITAIYEDADGTFWAALGNGLNKLRDGKFERVSLVTDATGWGVIYSLFGDLEGNLWLGLQANGLGRLRVKQLSTISTTDGLHNDSTRSVFQDSKGTIWIGTSSGFSTYVRGKIVNYTDIDGVRLDSVRSIAEDPDGNIWIASGGSLLLMKDGKLSRFPDWVGEFEIEVVYKDSLGRMWIGTNGEGIFLYENGKFTNYQIKDGLASNQVRSIIYDSRGALWISCFGNGVSKYSDGKFTTYTVSDGLAGNRALSLYEDDERSLWFSTREGLSRLKDGKFSTLTAESGLFVGFIYTILDDGRGNFWFSCAKGLFRVSKADLNAYADGKLSKVSSVDYGVRDGMKTRAFNLGNQPAAWKAADGSLMFCSLKGLVIVDPARILSSNYIPPVYIEDILINREKQSLNGVSQIPIGTGEVEIHFAGVSFFAPEKLRFKYMLEGFDPDWVEAGTRRFAYYANLAPGNYRFRVIAGNVDGAWNEAGASYDFYLQPHFYQTRWFIALIVIAVLLFVGMLYRFHTLEIKARYAAVLEERKRIAIEIHDTLAQNLAGIALQLDSVTMQSADLPDSQRKMLDQAGDLTRYSLSEARRAVSQLRSDEMDRRDLVVVLPEIANKMVVNTRIQVNIKITGSPRKLNPVTEKNLLRIFQEAMANAVKHSDAHRIEVELNYGIDKLIMRVADNGKGFDSNNTVPLSVGHYGLIGMRERAERIGGELTLSSEPGKGTELIVGLAFATENSPQKGLGLEH